jgi:peptide/nickel transport system ATP-binding protein
VNTASPSPLLEVESLEVAFPRGHAWVSVVRGVSLAIARGEVVGLVGESGAGKTLTAMATLRLVPPPGRILGGNLRFAGRDLLALDEDGLREIRGAGIGMVFQEPASAFDPLFTVGFQLSETVRAHRSVSRREAREQALALLDRVALPVPRQVFDAHPHQLSGGQRQRAMIALALAGGPSLLIADEPTAALDVLRQAQILELLERLNQELGLAVLLISHDLAVIARVCQRVVVLYCGQVVEEAPAHELFAEPRHPYTRALLRAVPRLGQPAPRGGMPVVPGQVPPAAARPTGCAFHPRCEHAMEACREIGPANVELGVGRYVRCLLYEPAPRDSEPAVERPSDARSLANGRPI